jgi:nucleotide-binding universal stress UspA family protein
VHTEEVTHVARSIVDHCITELDSDLVIMCTHGEGGTRRFVSGSLAQQVIARGNVPVLAVHAGHGSRREFECGKVLFPIGGQGNHGDIMDPARQFAARCGASIRLISVVPTFDKIPGKWTQVGRLLPGATSKILDLEAEEMNDFLEGAAAELRSTNVTTETSVLRGDPGSLIALDAEQSAAAMIVMATHGKSGLAAFWEGSVAPKVFAGSRKPIMLIPALPDEKKNG